MLYMSYALTDQRIGMFVLPAQMFRNERVVIVDVQLGALAAPAWPLRHRQWNQKVPA